MRSFYPWVTLSFLFIYKQRSHRENASSKTMPLYTCHRIRFAALSHKRSKPRPKAFSTFSWLTFEVKQKHYFNWYRIDLLTNDTRFSLFKHKIIHHLLGQRLVSFQTT